MSEVNDLLAGALLPAYLGRKSRCGKTDSKPPLEVVCNSEGDFLQTMGLFSSTAKRRDVQELQDDIHSDKKSYLESCNKPTTAEKRRGSRVLPPLQSETSGTAIRNEWNSNQKRVEQQSETSGTAIRNDWNSNQKRVEQQSETSGTAIRNKRNSNQKRVDSNQKRVKQQSETSGTAIRNEWNSNQKQAEQQSETSGQQSETSETAIRNEWNSNQKRVEQRSSVDKYRDKCQLAVGQQGQHHKRPAPSSDQCQTFFDFSSGRRQSASPQKASMTRTTGKDNDDLLSHKPAIYPAVTEPNTRTTDPT
ncbi:hypothetical protein Bbelb_140770 [Branchiostoma belcheri]|nr:hypothetical protein Bbelb_140770 [Branchiostoma belcheri]